MLHDARVAQLLARRKAGEDTREVLLALAVAFNVRNMPEDAKSAAAELLERDPADGEAWYEAIIAHSFGEPGELEALVPRVDRLVAERPLEAWTHRNQGLLRYYLERDDESRTACERALALDLQDSHAHEVLAYLAYTVGDMDAAIESGIQAVELHRENFRALHWLGECYARLGAVEQAVRYFQRALLAEDSFFFALESLGALYLHDQATFAEAWQCFAKILSVNPRYFPVYFRLADAFIQAERFDEAAAQAQHVLHLSPDRAAEADAHQYLGLLALMGQHADVARAHFERALELDDEFAAAHHYLGVVSEQEGRPEAAEAAWREALRLDPEYALPHVRLGYLHFDRKEMDLAERHFRQAVEIDAEEALAHLGLGEVARVRRDYRAQLEHCRAAAELAPEDSNVRNQLGTAHDALGELEEAAEQYEMALRLNPLDRQAANNLGYLYERRLKDAGARDAKALREKAVSAWKRRLLICRDTRSSTRGAKAHLQKLGVAARQVAEWLETEPPLGPGLADA